MTDFDRALPWLEAALTAQDARPLWSMDDVTAELRANKAQFWGGESAFFVTTVDNFSYGERVMSAWLGGGDMDEMLRMVPEMEAWGRQDGCTQAHVIGRKGWERVLNRLGYEHYATTLRKILR